ncbi:MAG: hypothetical protein AAB417_01790 [Patescibacteria group bacterium]
MITIIATIAFALFAGLYTLGIWMATWQEEELSLSHEKAVHMNIIIIAISFVLLIIALWAFIHINWDTLILTI